MPPRLCRYMYAHIPETGRLSATSALEPSSRRVVSQHICGPTRNLRHSCVVCATRLSWTKPACACTNALTMAANGRTGAISVLKLLHTRPTSLGTYAHTWRLKSSCNGQANGPISRSVLLVSPQSRLNFAAQLPFSRRHPSRGDEIALARTFSHCCAQTLKPSLRTAIYIARNAGRCVRSWICGSRAVKSSC